MENPRILVLLAAFNGGRWIRQQLDSILKQASVSVCVVVSDDGSTDDTAMELARFECDERVRVISPTEPTGSAAQNFLFLIRGNAAAHFDFVALADQDDIWNPDKLHRAVRLLGDSGAGYSSAVTAVWKDGRERLLTQRDSPTSSDFLFEGAGQGCTFVLSAAFYDRVRAFFVANEPLTRSLHYHDWAIYALARVWGLQWVYDAQSTMKYRQHARNDTGARNSLNGVTKRLGLIKSGWYRQQVATIAQLCLVADPANAVVAAWLAEFEAPDRLARRIRIARFFSRGGRRRKLDNVTLMAAALAGWI